MGVHFQVTLHLDLVDQVFFLGLRQNHRAGNRVVIGLLFLGSRLFDFQSERLWGLFGI